MKNTISSLLAVAVLLASALASRADAQKPAVVVSVASPQELMNDFTFLANSAGAGDFVGLAQLLAQQYMNLMDVNQPAGLAIDMTSGEPVPIAFLPVKKFDDLNKMLVHHVGEPQDLGNGVFKLALDQPVFMKHRGNVLFLAQTAEALGTAPANPAALLEGMPATYDVAVRCNVQNIPRNLRDMAVSQIKSGFERQMQQNPRSDAREQELQQNVGKGALEQIVQLIEQADSVTFGLGVDQNGRNTFVDFAMTALPNTELAVQMNAASNTMTSFAGFNLDNAAASMIFSSAIQQREIQQTTAMLATLEAKLMEEIDGDTKFDARGKSALKEIVTSLMTVAKKTIASGKMDGGGVVLLRDSDPKLQLAAGGYVADGAEFDRAFRKAVNLASSSPNFPGVKLDAGSHRGVAFHTIQIDSPDDDARKVFGAKLSAAVGIGATSVYVSLGGDPIATLKQVIDSSGQSQRVLPMQVRVSLSPFIRFAKMMDERPEAQAVLDALAKSQGRDHVVIAARPINNGMQYRLFIEDGILQAIGAGVRGGF